MWTPGCLQWRRPSVSVQRWKGRAGLASINQTRLQRQRDLQLPSTAQPPLLCVTRHTRTHTLLTLYVRLGLWALMHCTIFWLALSKTVPFKITFTSAPQINLSYMENIGGNSESFFMGLSWAIFIVKGKYLTIPPLTAA